MNTALTVALTLGAVGTVGGVAYLATRHKAAPKPSSPAPALPAPTPTPSTTLPVSNNAATQADIAALEAARVASENARIAAEAAAKKAAQIQTLQSSAANIENHQMLVFAGIDSVNRDDSRLNDFINQAFQDSLNTPRFASMVAECHKTVSKNCGWDVFGACNGPNQPVCDKREPDFSWGNPASVLMNEARATGGPALLAGWKQSSRLPLEADLARLEVQYQGVLNELASLGASYQPQAPKLHK
jgi:hypothetical protein